MIFYFQYIASTLHGIHRFSDESKRNFYVIQRWTNAICSASGKYENGLQRQKEISRIIEGEVWLNSQNSFVAIIESSQNELDNLF